MFLPLIESSSSSAAALHSSERIVVTHSAGSSGASSSMHEHTCLYNSLSPSPRRPKLFVQLQASWKQQPRCSTRFHSHSLPVLHVIHPLNASFPWSWPSVICFVSSILIAHSVLVVDEARRTLRCNVSFPTTSDTLKLSSVVSVL